MSKLGDALRGAKSVIDTPEKWTQGASHRTRDGSPSPGPEDDFSHCMYGAVRAGSPKEFWKACDRAIEAVTKDGIGRWNDRPGRTHAEVMAKLDEAIAAAEAAEEG